MGAWERFWCPDLTRLFETVSLEEHDGYLEHVWHDGGDRPDFSSKVVNGVPSQWPVSDTSPPPHEICRCNIGMCMEVVRHRYLVVPEGRSYEADLERRVGLAGGHRRRCGC